MKKQLYIFLIFLCPLFVFSQSVEVMGKLKVSEMDTVNTENLLVVKRSDGTLAARQVASLSAPVDTTRSLERDFLLTSTLCNCPNLPPAMIQSLLNNGYTPADLVGFNTSTNDLLAGGISLGDIISGGGSIEDLIAAGFSTQELIDAGASIEDLIGAGVLIEDLIALDFSPIYLWEQGVPIDSLYNQMYEGGLIFYLDTSYVYPFEGLVATTFDLSLNAEWGCKGTGIIGAGGTAIGTGAQNTIDIAGQCNTPGIAAELCSNLSENGYDDWFLPSKNELYQMLHNIDLGILDWYYQGHWSSTEGSGFNFLTEAWVNGFNGEYSEDKDNPLYVRAVRAF